MKHFINLLPTRYRQEQGLQTKHLLWGTAIMVLLFIGGMYGVSCYSTQRMEQEMVLVDNDIQDIQPLLIQIKGNQAIENRILTRVNVLEKIARERPLMWSQILFQLGEATPGELWLTEVTCIPDGGIRVRGGSRDIDVVTQYMRNLESNQNFEKITFMGLEQKDLNIASKGTSVPPINVVSYELSLRLKGGSSK